MLLSPLITPVPNLAQETDDFCILETPGSREEVRIDHNVNSNSCVWIRNKKTYGKIILMVNNMCYRILIRSHW